MGLATRENDGMLDDPASVAGDIALLERLRGVLRSAPREAGEQHLRCAGELHRIAVPDWSALAHAAPAVGVGFFGQARQGVDHAPLALLEDAIVGRAGELPGLLAYHNALLAPGRWANLVVFADADAIAVLRGDALHDDAVARTAAHYRALRLHRGALPGGALGAAPFAHERTLFFDFDAEPPRRWMSDCTDGV
jgi:hypothetical protein